MLDPWSLKMTHQVLVTWVVGSIMVNVILKFWMRNLTIQLFSVIIPLFIELSCVLPSIFQSHLLQICCMWERVKNLQWHILVIIIGKIFRGWSTYKLQERQKSYLLILTSRLNSVGSLLVCISGELPPGSIIDCKCFESECNAYHCQSRIVIWPSPLLKLNVFIQRLLFFHI